MKLAIFEATNWLHWHTQCTCLGWLCRLRDWMLDKNWDRMPVLEPKR